MVDYRCPNKHQFKLVYDGELPFSCELYWDNTLTKPYKFYTMQLLESNTNKDYKFVQGWTNSNNIRKRKALSHLLGNTNEYHLLIIYNTFWEHNNNKNMGKCNDNIKIKLYHDLIIAERAFKQKFYQKTHNHWLNIKQFIPKPNKYYLHSYANTCANTSTNTCANTQITIVSK